MSFNQLLILLFIQNEPGIGRGMIYDKLLSVGLSPANVDVQLRALERSRLIQRTTKGRGRSRSTTQKITKAGQEKIKKFLPSFRTIAQFVA